MMLCLTAFALAGRAAGKSMVGQLTDFDGYATNAALTLTIAPNGTSSEWAWKWDHDSSGKAGVPVDFKCDFSASASGDGSFTACKGQTYYWFQGTLIKDATTGEVVGLKGDMLTEKGEACGKWGVGAYAPSSSFPVQIHLGLGYDVSTVTVSWATYESTVAEGMVPGGGTVEWSLTESLASSQTAPGDARPFTMDKGRTWYTHVANMTNLKPSTRYWYRVHSADAKEASKVFSFRTQPTKDTLDSSLPELHLIYGDMGARDAFTLCSTCSGKSLVCDATTCASANQSAGLIAEINNTNHIVHVGDFAYNLQDGGGTVGDQFMVNIEQVAANVPYMVSVGNHENSAGNLAHFTERFRSMPSNTGNVATQNKPGTAQNNWYFSWNAGLVHYVAISTELYFGVKSEVDGDEGTLEKMYEWIQKDLAAANVNRDAVPWIIVHGHRSIYCSCDGDCDGAANVVKDGVKQSDGSLKYGLEDVLFKNGVDFFINGHEHDYERSWPVYKDQSDQSNLNPKGTIYVVTGAAGSSELHEPFTREQPKWSSYRSNTFGYSRMYIHNHTHLHWQQVQTDPTLFGPELYGRVIDDTWIIQTDHGPFDLNDAPSGRCPDDKGCQTGISYDHWLPLLDPALADYRYHTLAGVNHTNHTHVGTRFAGKEYELISRFRNHNGAGQWKREELNLLARAIAELDGVDVAAGEGQTVLGKNTVWEDIHEDGNSDGRWENATWRNELS